MEIEVKDVDGILARLLYNDKLGNPSLGEKVYCLMYRLSNNGWYSVDNNSNIMDVLGVSRQNLHKYMKGIEAMGLVKKDGKLYEMKFLKEKNINQLIIRKHENK